LIPRPLGRGDSFKLISDICLNNAYNHELKDVYKNFLLVVPKDKEFVMPKKVIISLL